MHLICLIFSTSLVSFVFLCCSLQGTKAYADLITYASITFDLPGLLANIISQKKHFENCWWPVDSGVPELNTDGNGRQMLSRGSWVETVWKNLGIDFPRNSGPVFLSSWLSNWITSYNLHRNVQWNHSPYREYLPINAHSLDEIAAIVSLQKQLHIPISNTSLANFDFFAPSNPATPAPLRQSFGIECMGEVQMAQEQLKPKLKPAAILVLTGIIQDAMTQVSNCFVCNC